MHPDLSVIDEGENELKVDLARRIKAENAIIPNDGARRVTVIRHAHKLNPMAQNALLKELEEPPAYAFFILTAEQPDALLQTVRSRCTRLALEPPQQTASIPPRRCWQPWVPADPHRTPRQAGTAELPPSADTVRGHVLSLGQAAYGIYNKGGRRNIPATSLY